MSLLPEKFSATKEGTSSLFPSYDATPLVIELGKIAIGTDYISVMLTEESL
jgi:hypothetical protein